MEVWDFSPQEEGAEHEDVLEGDDEEEESKDMSVAAGFGGEEETDAEMLDVESEAEVGRRGKGGVGEVLPESLDGDESEEMTE